MLITSAIINRERFPITIFSTRDITILKIINTEKYKQFILGFFDIKKQERYTKSFLNRNYQKDSKKTSQIVRTFTIKSDRYVYMESTINLLEKKYQENQKIQISDFFKEKDPVLIKAYPKGKGFMGVMKRHNFKGLNKTHGVSIKHRSGGSIGSRNPNRVLKGKKMAGREHNIICIQNLKIYKINNEKNILVVKGISPGYTGSMSKIVLKPIL